MEFDEDKWSSQESSQESIPTEFPFDVFSFIDTPPADCISRKRIHQEMNPQKLEIHRGLPRQGPGSDASTKRAVDIVKSITKEDGNRRILDVGCGPGKQTRVLASQFKGSKVIALDLYRHYLDELEQSISGDEELKKAIQTRVGSMFELKEALGNEEFDIIWAEGSIYIIGLEKGLKEWKELLDGKRGGFIVASHLSWLTEEPPEEIKKFWQEGKS